MSKYGKFHDACHASGQRYTSYASAVRPDDANTIPCPVCNKRVKLRALYPAARREPARKFVVIPFHNAAQQPAVPEDVARVNKQMLDALEEVLPALPTRHRPKVNAAIDAARKAGGAA